MERPRQPGVDWAVAAAWALILVVSGVCWAVLAFVGWMVFR